MEALAKSNPQNAEWRRALSVADNKAGRAALAQGDAPEALRRFRDGLAVIEALAEIDPANAGWQRDVAVSYNLVGNVLVDAARVARSAQVLPRGSRLSCNVSAASDPSNAQWQNDLQFCIGRIGLVAWNAVLASDFAMAMDAADQAIGLAPRRHGSTQAGPTR